jgi:serine/threonine protein phosphatase PrpC
MAETARPGDEARFCGRTDVQASLDSLGAEEGLGVSVDKRMLHERKSTRGFTVCAASSTAQEFVDEESIVTPQRREKRADTLPPGNFGDRHGDIEFSAETRESLESAHQMLQARFRRGSVTFQEYMAVVTTEAFPAAWSEHCSVFVYGALMGPQATAAERNLVWFPEGSGPASFAFGPPVISCIKGCKGARDMTPNQDNISIAQFKNGWTCVCCMDGHGPMGHLVSTRAVQTVPYYLCNIPSFEEDMRESLTLAFERSHKDCVGLSLQDGWDIQASGTTALCCVFKGDKVWTAHAGDSRLAFGSEKHKGLIYETGDHKPESPEEQKRINDCGGEVRSQTYPDGWTSHRMFVRGQDYPGLCMSRTIGDEAVKAHGVIASPEVGELTLDLGENPFVVLASDGVWEFMDSEFVVKAVAKKIQSDGPEKTVQKLQREAKKRWRQEEGDYCDDITSILVQLKPM